MIHDKFYFFYKFVYRCSWVFYKNFNTLNFVLKKKSNQDAVDGKVEMGYNKFIYNGLGEEYFSIKVDLKVILFILIKWLSSKICTYRPSLSFKVK